MNYQYLDSPVGRLRLVSDGQHGAIVIWKDERGFVAKDIYAQRLDGDGNPLWTNDGVPVCTAANVQDHAALVSDGLGGAFIVWQDARAGGSDYWDIYVQRLNANGMPQWSGNGLPVCTAGGDQQWPGIVTDGNGGAIIAWQDSRNPGRGRSGHIRLHEKPSGSYPN